MEKTMQIQLTLWQEDSPVSHSQSQETEGGQTMTAISGLRCLELSKKPNQDGSLERMFLASSTWHSTMCKLTWRENTTKSGNSYYRLLPSMRTTEEIESSSSPTETQLWPTPMARDYKDTGKNTNYEALAKKGKLAGAVMWPTPMAHEARLGYQDRSRGKKGTQESLTTKVINNLGGRQEVSGQLNPEWVEWLMGFPIGWTESKD